MNNNNDYNKKNNENSHKIEIEDYIFSQQWFSL